MTRSTYGNIIPTKLEKKEIVRSCRDGIGILVYMYVSDLPRSCTGTRTCKNARMVKLVDTYVSDAYAERCEGSSPSPSNYNKFSI